MTTKLLLADNQPIVFEGLKSATQATNYILQGIVSKPAAIPDAISEYQPDVLVAESRFSGQDVLGVLERMFHDPAQLKIVIYSKCNNPTAIARAAAIQVNDYVLKTEPVQNLIDSIQNAIDGRDASSTSLLMTAKSSMRRPRQTVRDDVPLTKRELQVLQHVALGLSNREVGKSLGISVETAKEHVQNILRKLDVNDRTQAAVWAVKRGLA